MQSENIKDNMSTELLKKDREFVVPGDEIVRSMDFLPGKNCFREGESLYAKRLGLVSVSNRVISVIPLNSVYIPKVGDMVVAQVMDIQSNGWVLDIEAPHDAFLPLSGIREYIDTTKTPLSTVYGLGDIVYAKVTVAQKDSIYLSMQDPRARKLTGGRIIKINPAKVPRLIGKAGSMVSMIKNKTGCKISIGQNGLVWFEGGKEDLVIKAIKMVEEEAYIEGLTDKIAKLLEGGK